MIERTVQDSVKLEVDRSVEERLRTEGMGKAHKVNPQVEGRAGGQKKKTWKEEPTWTRQGTEIQSYNSDCLGSLTSLFGSQRN